MNAPTTLIRDFSTPYKEDTKIHYYREKKGLIKRELVAIIYVEKREVYPADCALYKEDLLELYNKLVELESVEDYK